MEGTEGPVGKKTKGGWNTQRGRVGGNDQGEEGEGGEL